MGFLVRVHPFDFAVERRYFLAQQGGHVVGFLVAVPVYARGGWLFEDVVRDPGAPNGTTELLVDAAMRVAAEQGCTYVTLGLVPLSGAVSGWLRLARNAASALYDFRGLRAFRAKLKPTSWEPLFLTFPRNRLGTVALYDALSAFAAGGFLRFGFSTLSRGPAIVVQALALLLIPWTALLAAAPSSPWFPTPSVKWGWVAFDSLLVVGLLVLAQRWRRGLSTLLASLISLDAATTWGEALGFNLRSIRSAGEAALVAVAMLAPTVAALLLWTSRRHHLRGKGAG
jgi:phosphatidylglycerol lysyltransferase